MNGNKDRDDHKLSKFCTEILSLNNLNLFRNASTSLPIDLFLNEKYSSQDMSTCLDRMTRVI